MDNQKEKRGAAENRDTKNLSELLEFDFDSVNEEEVPAPAEKDKTPEKQGDEYLNSFFVEDMGLPPLPEAETVKKADSGMSDAFSKAQEQTRQPKKKAQEKPPVKKADPAQMKPVRKRRVWEIIKGVLVWSKEIIVALVLVWLLLTFVAQNSTVYGSSMSPTLTEGEMIVMNKFIYRITEPQRGDVIVFRYEDPIRGEELLIKRIVGLPGDSIEIMDGSVYINGIPYDESKYLQVDTEIIGNITYPFVVPENSYFVMGDNRANSKDSRFAEVGAVSEDQIVGKASFRFWPLEKLGLIQ